MYLHAPLDDIQRFAGKHGEDDAHHALRALQPWRAATPIARTAIWHAGQVLRAARSVPPYQLRGADTIMVYYAALTLWAYAALGPPEDEDADGGVGADAVVFLDGPRADVHAAFLAGAAGGRPVLWSFGGDPQGDEGGGTGVRRRSDDAGGAVVRVRPSLVMRVGAQVLEGNYPNAERDALPPLIVGLRNLMRDLGRLP